MEFIRPDYCIPIDTGDSEYVLSPRYDFIRVFPFIGWSIMNVVTDTGVAQLHLTEDEGRRVAQQSGIGLIEFNWITDHDYNKYLDAQTKNLSDEWLE